MAARDQTLEQELDGKSFTRVYDARHRTVRGDSTDDGVEWL